MATVIGSLLVTLGLNSASFESGARRARSEGGRLQKTFTGLGKGLAAAFSVGAVVGVANELRVMNRAALDAAGGIGEQAKALGVTTEALQQFRYAATQVGLSTEEMDASLGQFSKRLGQAELSGKGPFVQALKQIGLSLDDLKDKSTTEQIALIAEGIKGAGSEAQKSALAVAFFGKSGQQMGTFLKDGAAGVKALADEANRLGIIISEKDIANADAMADSLGQIDYVVQARLNKTMLEHSRQLAAAEVAWGEFKIKAIAALGDIIVELEKLGSGTWVERLRAGTNIALGLFNPVALGAEAMGRRVGEAYMAMQAAVAEATGKMVSAISGWITDRLSAIWDGAIAKVEAFKKAVRGMYISVVGASDVPDMVIGIAREIAKLDAVMVDPAISATDRISDSFADMASRVSGAFAGLAQSIKSGGFFDILHSAVGLVTQLGSIGLFGKSFAARINESANLPRFAGGTNFAPGGLALVGERGPELVNLPRGSKVYPNGYGPAGSRVEIVPSRYFDVVVDGRIAGAAPAIAAAGGRAGVEMMQRMNSRSLAG